MFTRARRSGKPKSRKESGAVAVEAALIIPIFLVLVLGIFEFGRAFNIQVSLSEAARESARYAAVHGAEAGFTAGDAQTVGVAAAPSVALDPANVGISYEESDGTPAAECAAGVNAISTVIFPTEFLTGLDKLIDADKPFTLTGRGVMRCGG